MGKQVNNKVQALRTIMIQRGEWLITYWDIGLLLDLSDRC
jgi:hypothetical protein